MISLETLILADVRAAGKMISEQDMLSGGMCYCVVGVKFPINLSKGLAAIVIPN